MGMWLQTNCDPDSVYGVYVIVRSWVPARTHMSSLRAVVSCLWIARARLRGFTSPVSEEISLSHKCSIEFLDLSLKERKGYIGALDPLSVAGGHPIQSPIALRL
jgi:hypothetical protein